MTYYYPIYLNLEGRLVIIVGGGDVALEKAQGLLPTGSRIRVIAPKLHSELEEMESRGDIEVVRRTYRHGDLEGAFLIFSERLGEVTHRALLDEAEAEQQWLNVQDETEFCSFIAASVMRRGDLTLTISTAGRAPALAVRIRQRMERFFGQHYADFLELCGSLRRPLATKYPDFQRRRGLWYELMESDVLNHLRRGEEQQAQALALEVMQLEEDDLQLPVGAGEEVAA